MHALDRALHEKGERLGPRRQAAVVARVGGDPIGLQLAPQRAQLPLAQLVHRERDPPGDQVQVTIVGAAPRVERRLEPLLVCAARARALAAVGERVTASTNAFQSRPSRRRSPAAFGGGRDLRLGDAAGAQDPGMRADHSVYRSWISCASVTRWRPSAAASSKRPSRSASLDPLRRGLRPASPSRRVARRDRPAPTPPPHPAIAQARASSCSGGWAQAAAHAAVGEIVSPLMYELRSDSRNSTISAISAVPRGGRAGPAFAPRPRRPRSPASTGSSARRCSRARAR